VERVARPQTNSSPLTSHAAQESFFTLIISLLGLSLTGGALLVMRSPMLYFSVILASGVLFAIATGMLSRWFRRYSRRRSRQGTLARGQVASLFAFLAVLLQAILFLIHFGLSTMKWRGF
jgi:hypothetical protein